MRPRWTEWVITLALVALGVTGIWTIWGADLARLVHPETTLGAEATPAAEPGPAGAAVAAPAAPPARQPVKPPAGSVQETF